MNVTGSVLSWFGSERDRELRDLQALHARVRRANQACAVFSVEALDNATMTVLERACRAAECDNISWAVDVGYEPVRVLLEHEFRVLPEFAPRAWQELTLRDKSDVRSFLTRRAKMLADPERTLDLACAAIQDVLSKVLQASSAPTGTSANGQLTLTANALEWMRDAPELVESCWSSFFSEELTRAGLFEHLREQLWRNTLFASGLDPSDANAGKKITRPTEAKRRSTRQLVDDYLAHTPLAWFFDAEIAISVPDEVRFEHTHILGGSGHGKTQLLLHLIHQDLTREEGPGLVVIDSQGDLVRTLSHLQLFAPGNELAERLVIIDPADVEFPVALSLFDTSSERTASYSPAERERVLNGAIEMYEYMFGALLGAELTQKQGVIFRFLARLMMVVPNATLHTLLDLMEHGERFRSYMAQLDGTAKRFFDEEFFHPSFGATKKQIAKRLWGILANPVFERLFSQPRGKFDFFEAMQSRKIVLISTAKDLLRQEGAEIFGRFLVAKLTQAVMERAALPIDQRPAALVYIDESHEYVDDHLAFLLNQARKYRVGLTLAHQNLDQLPASLRATVMSSTSIKLAGGVSAKDARALADDMHTNVEFLQSMSKQGGKSVFACHVRNVTPAATSVSVPIGHVNSLPQLDDEAFVKIIQLNRERFCNPIVVHSPENSQPDPSAKEETTPHVAKPSLPGSDAYLAGQGGRQHRYLQHLLRAAAHENGFSAELEANVEGHPVDVVIHAQGRRIACEVSISTDAEHEAASVAKCLEHGFHKVWVVTRSKRKRIALEKVLPPKFPEHAVKVLTVEEAVTELSGLASDEPKSDVVRGYRVSVRSGRPNSSEAEDRKRIAAMLARSMKKRD